MSLSASWYCMLTIFRWEYPVGRLDDIGASGIRRANSTSEMLSIMVEGVVCGSTFGWDGEVWVGVWLSGSRVERSKSVSLLVCTNTLFLKLSVWSRVREWKILVGDGLRSPVDSGLVVLDVNGSSSKILQMSSWLWILSFLFERGSSSMIPLNVHQSPGDKGCHSVVLKSSKMVASTPFESDTCIATSRLRFTSLTLKKEKKVFRERSISVDVDCSRPSNCWYSNRSSFVLKRWSLLKILKPCAKHCPNNFRAALSRVSRSFLR